MPNVNFYLKEPDANAETLLCLHFAFNKKRLVYSTGFKIQPRFWNKDKQRAIASKQFPQYPELNAFHTKP